MHKDSKFPKSERLKSQIAISKLFRRDSPSFAIFPIRFFILEDQAIGESYPQVLVTVSKKNFKRAVDRNRIKRLVREAYRTQKVQLNGVQAIGFLYLSKELPTFAQVSGIMESGIRKVRAKYGISFDRNIEEEE